MEIVSNLNQKERYSCGFEVYPYLRDHHREGKVILPAVESLIILARVVKDNYPQSKLSCLENAVFPRFLTIAPDTLRQQVLVDLENMNNGDISASLLTAVKSKDGSISRKMEHAGVIFSKADFQKAGSISVSELKKPEGDSINIPSNTIYRDLVPFGKSYQNIMGNLSVSPNGAFAHISGGDDEADKNLLGSPFPLDAAMHAACVWGQRFAGIVCFPVGFARRIIYQKTKKGEEYLGRIVPVNMTRELLVFDVWIFKDDVMYESISGLQMKDVSQGRIRPPQWIMVGSGWRRHF